MLGGAAALAAALWAAAPCASLDAAAAEPANLESLRAAALERVNEARRRNDRSPLAPDDALDAAAQSHAEDMLERGYYGHRSPEGTTPADRYRAAGGESGGTVAENVARRVGRGRPVTEAVVDRLHAGWMESPEHRANVLAPGVDRFGFGIAAGDDRLYAVQTFAGPGTPIGSTPGEGAAPVGAERVQSLAIERINAARQEAGAPPLAPSPGLAEALRTALADADPAAFDLSSVGSPLDLLPADRRGDWRSASVLAGRCEGCGAEVTAADVRFFVGQWLGNPEYRAALTDPRHDGFGMAVTADGRGRKLALGAVAGE